MPRFPHSFSRLKLRAAINEPTSPSYAATRTSTANTSPSAQVTELGVQTRDFATAQSTNKSHEIPEVSVPTSVVFSDGKHEWRGVIPLSYPQGMFSCQRSYTGSLKLAPDHAAHFVAPDMEFEECYWSEWEHPKSNTGCIWASVHMPGREFPGGDYYHRQTLVCKGTDGGKLPFLIPGGIAKATLSLKNSDHIPGTADVSATAESLVTLVPKDSPEAQSSG